jgi:hypothetical protein
MSHFRRYAGTIAIGVLMGLPLTAAAAGPQPTGTISCSIVAPASSAPNKGVTFRPFIDADPRVIRIGAVNLDSSCDDSGVTGATTPIVHVAVRFNGKMRNGTCAELTTAPVFDRGQVRLKWQGVNPAGHTFTVASSRAKLGSASYDSGSGALILVTQPLIGAFPAGTATVHLGFDFAAEFKQICDAHGSGFVAMPFGETNPSTVQVQ